MSARTELCPHPRKKAFDSRDQAERSMHTVWSRSRAGGALPSRAYLCRCSAWHLTSKPDFRSPTSAPNVGEPPDQMRQLVEADLRDVDGTGPQHALLRSRDNLIGWLQVLLDVLRSMVEQNDQDNARLKTHPERPSWGRNPSLEYLYAKRAVEDVKQARSRVLRTADARVAEARGLIRSDPVLASTGVGKAELLRAARRRAERHGHRSDEAGKEARALLARTIREVQS